MPAGQELPATSGVYKLDKSNDFPGSCIVTRVTGGNKRARPEHGDGDGASLMGEISANKGMLAPVMLTPEVPQPKGVMKWLLSWVWRKQRATPEQEEVKKLRNMLLQVLPEMEVLKAQVEDLKVQLKVQGGTLEETRQELEEIRQELGETRQELKDTRQELDETSQELEKTRQELKETRQELKDTRQELKETSQELEKTRQELKQVKVKAETDRAAWIERRLRA
eukprot:jgi/Tetstr1/424691/TSEL_015210.t1